MSSSRSAYANSVTATNEDKPGEQHVEKMRRASSSDIFDEPAVLKECEDESVDCLQDKSDDLSDQLRKVVGGKSEGILEASYDQQCVKKHEHTRRKLTRKPWE